MMHRCHFRFLWRQGGEVRFICRACGTGFVRGRLFAPLN